jgi:hypothetical protein
MIIEEEKYKKCKQCGRREFISNKKYGCDKCKNPINKNSEDNEYDYLEISIFYHNDSDSKSFQFCSWECVLSFIKNVQKTKYKTDYFISMPYLSFDFKDKNINFEGFLKHIK